MHYNFKMDQFSTHPTDALSLVSIKYVKRAESNNNNSCTEPGKQSVLGKDMETASNSSSHTSIDSTTLRMIDQFFADYMSKSKSLQRVESRYDPIPRFFLPKGKDSHSHTKTSHLLAASPSYQIFPDVKDVEETTQSPSSLKFEKSSKLISADNLSNDNDDNDNGKGNTEICDKNRISSLPPKLDSAHNVNKEKHTHNEAAKSQSSIMSIETLNDNDHSAVSSSPYKSISDDQILELKQPQMSSSITLSINSAASNATNNTICRSIYDDDDDDDELDNSKKRECVVIPSKTIQVSSQDSLRQIESFHRDFVGSLSSLSGTLAITDEKKTLTDLVVKGKSDSLEGNSSDNKGNVGEQIKNCGKSPLEEEEKISQDQNLQGSEEADGISSKVHLNPPTPSSSITVGSNMTEDNNNDAIIQPTTCERADQQPLSSPAWGEDSGCPIEKITGYVNEYIDSLEREWQIRRNVWLENNKHNPDSKRRQNSVYACDTFRDYMTNIHFSQKIDLQFPFNLPEVVENNGNPILLDQIVPLQPLPESSPKKLKKPEKPSQIPRMNVVGGTTGGNTRSTGRKVIDSGYKVASPRVTNEVASVKMASSPGITKKSNELVISPSVTNTQMGTEDVRKDMEEQEVARPSPELKKSTLDDDFWGELKNLGNNDDTSKIDEIFASFAQTHVNLLEAEWSQRRDVWIAKNMYDADSVYQSFKTFKEALVHKQIPHQFPFQLPDTNAKKKIIQNDEPDVSHGLSSDNNSLKEIEKVADSTNKYSTGKVPSTKVPLKKKNNEPLNSYYNRYIAIREFREKKAKHDRVSRNVNTITPKVMNGFR